jgi:hypothetical protein
MTRDVVRRFFLGIAPALLGVAVTGGATPACYSAGTGTSPPPKSFYFPVGLAVSKGGNVLYVVNSDFDLQWNGGTLQSYDLLRIRGDAACQIQRGAFVQNCPRSPNGRAGGSIPYVPRANGTLPPLGQAKSPPVDSTQYYEDSATIGAFATDLQLSVSGRRLFAPVRGDTTLTWADVAYDDPNGTGPADPTLDCGARVDGRCDVGHRSGSDPNEDGDTRHVTMPGEPFGMAQTENGAALAITHQTDTKTSLLVTGTGSTADMASPHPPSMQFVLDGLPTGGNGIAAVPHDPDAVPPPCETNGNVPPCVRPAFLQTSRNTPELDLLRYYNDDGSPSPSLHRPFLAKEAAYLFTANAPGTDSRGIAIDPTPRMACKWRATTFQTTPPYVVPPSPADATACGELPARVFFANRSPPSLVVGEIGKPAASGDGTYDPDLLKISDHIPMPVGPSRVYLAPIVDAAGNYALRVFIVCFDANAVVVYDPDAKAVESTIYVGQGPFAMAFDPFETQEVARNAPVQPDARQAATLNLKRYRFAYVASFTGSFVQLIDLDQQSSPATFESVVFTLGQPTKPKGT